MDEKDLKTVCGTRLFAGLDPDSVVTLLQGSAPRTHHKGQILFEQGDPANTFYIVLEGWVKVFRPSVGGDEAVFGVFTAGESFGEAAMFIQGQFPAAAQVVEDARLIAVHSDVFRKRVRNDPDLAFEMLASMSRHLHSLMNQVEQLQTRSSAQRLAQFLVSLAPVAVGAAVVALPYDKSLIAHRLGMKPESLSRAFMRLRSQGVTTDGNRVMVGDVGQLRAYGETGPLRERLASH
ncbi:MAG: Crp/Fnr family transcriptional regulator [Alphaproteobacteria bacterium]|nr:Crp/Fnr family transcriptional regulator [Alphaproteobacteria bacterium]